MTEKNIHKSVVITAIVCLSGMEVAALFRGINGTQFTVIAAFVAALAGYTMPRPIKIIE